MRLYLALFLLVPCLARAEVLERVRASGHLRCGVVAEQADFDKRDTHGNVAVFATDMCRAVAAAVFGNTAGLQLQGFPDAPYALKALQDGKLDVVYGVSPRPEWAPFYKVAFGQPVFMDGQSVMVPARAGISDLAGLAGAQVCFIGNTGLEQRITAALQARHVAFKPFPFQETGEMEAALVTGHCGAETADVSALAADRTGFHARQRDFVILPPFALDPYVPAVPANDTAWGRVVDAAFFALVQAEADGVTKANVAREAHDSGAAWGLPDGWREAVIGAVGNYGEVFNRDLGEDSPLRLPRGLNKSWSEGGVLWSPPGVVSQ